MLLVDNIKSTLPPPLTSDNIFFFFQKYSVYLLKETFLKILDTSDYPFWNLTNKDGINIYFGLQHPNELLNHITIR